MAFMVARGPSDKEKCKELLSAVLPCDFGEVRETMEVKVQWMNFTCRWNLFTLPWRRGSERTKKATVCGRSWRINQRMSVLQQEAACLGQNGEECKLVEPVSRRSLRIHTAAVNHSLTHLHALTVHFVRLLSSLRRLVGFSVRFGFVSEYRPSFLLGAFSEKTFTP